MKILKTLLVLLTAVMLTACGAAAKKGDIVGTWVETFSDGTVTTEYKADGTYTEDMQLSTDKLLSDGTYEFDGNELTIHDNYLETDITYGVSIDGDTMTLYLNDKLARTMVKK